MERAELASVDYWSTDRSRNSGCTFNIINGGRGIGKTYGTLTDFLTADGKFIYMRRTDRTIQAISNPAANPFKRINHDTGRDIQAEYSSKSSIGYFSEAGKTIGYALALSTAANIRGMDFYDVENLLYDECVPLPGERSIKGEEDAFFNIYETINRNRELEGKKPVTCFICSNSVSINAPIYRGFKIVTIMEKMRQTGHEFYSDRQRGIHIECIGATNVSTAKAQTALYRAIQGGDYYKHAINNEFAYDDFGDVTVKPINEYQPMFSVNGIYAYVHKTGSHIYISAKAHPVNPISTEKYKRFYLQNIQTAITRGAIFYESMELKYKLTTT